MPKATKSKQSSVSQNSISELLVLKYKGKRVISKRETCYRDTIKTCRLLFPDIPNDRTITLSTKDLAICEDEMAIVSEQIWETVIGQVNSVVVTVEQPTEAVAVTKAKNITPASEERKRNGKITIHVLYYGDRVIDVQLSPSRKVSQLSEFVATKMGKCSDNLRLMFNGMRMSKDRTLESYDVEEGDEIDSRIDQIGGKPVIYLSSPTPIEATVKLSLAAQWDFSAIYPVVPIKSRTHASNQEVSWEVKVHSNGDLTELTTGLDVAYLFWEAHTNSNVARPPTPPPSPGGTRSSTEDIDVFYPNDADLNDTDSVVLSIDDITPYLDRVLSSLCLHTEARTSFITYWLPSLLKHKYVALRFVPQKSYEHAAPLSVSPTPDILTRIFMVFKGVADDELSQWPAASNRASEDVRMWQGIVGIDAERARDTTPFRVLEWGGMEVIQKA